MAFRIRRQQRKWRLLDAGFLPFEAQAISSVPSRVPFLKELIRDRRLAKRKAIKEGRTRAELEAQIKFEYEAKDWIIREAAVTRRGMIGRADPWAMLRHYEELWRGKHPEYESPHERRKRKKQYDPKTGLRIDKGQIAAQRKRRKEREKQRRMQEQ